MKNQMNSQKLRNIFLNIFTIKTVGVMTIQLILNINQNHRGLGPTIDSMSLIKLSVP